VKQVTVERAEGVRESIQALATSAGDLPFGVKVQLSEEAAAKLQEEVASLEAAGYKVNIEDEQTEAEPQRRKPGPKPGGTKSQGR